MMKKRVFQVLALLLTFFVTHPSREGLGQQEKPPIVPPPPRIPSPGGPPKEFPYVPFRNPGPPLVPPPPHKEVE